MKRRMYKVLNNRALFRCPACRKTDRFSVRPDQNVKVLTCVKCGERVRCVLNRRSVPRMQQEGRIRLKNNDIPHDVMGDVINISRDGVCIRVRDHAVVVKLLKGMSVEISCDWNRHLFGSRKYVIVNKKEKRIGLQRCV